jgi:hypothetical protein
MAKGRPKDTVPSIRLRLEGRVKPGVDPEVDKLLAWLNSLPPRTRFPAVIARLIGGGLIQELDVDNDEQIKAQIEAAQQIMANFVID